MAKKKRLSTRLIPLLILVVLVIGGIVLHKKRAAQIARVPRQAIAPWALHVATVSDRPVDSGFPALARVSTREEITLTARISGRIQEMGPREGVRVRKGALLVRIDTREIEDRIHALQAQRVAARAEANRARDELAREKKLLQDGGSSRSAVEARRTAFVTASQKARSLEHEINSLEVQKGYGVIRSPANGVIARRLAEPGDLAVPGRPIYRITSSSGALVRVELPQAILHQVRPGTPIILYHNGQTVSLPVDRIFPTLDARALGFVEADLDAIPFDLLSGSRVACRVVLRQVRDAVRIPYGSLLCGRDRQHCRVARVVQQEQGHRLEMVPVTVGLRGHKGIAVRGDLHAGDRVVVAHQSILLRLKDGDPVHIAQGELP
ncbi:MAG TPA: efflux RND transporter periplasmic adaptor subunit [Desulfobulbus sp.]|nr:efflux RND transporter periplasmic adaptor subunit [Desulfobulbus sp.]